MVLFMPGMAFGTAAGVLAGQNLGAGHPERAERSAWMAVAVVEAFLITASIAILVGAEGIIGIFNSEPGVVATASDFLRIAVCGYAVLGLTSVLMSTLSGTGDTVPPMIVSLVTIWFIQLPLAYYLPTITDLGVLGIRWAMVSTMVVGGIAYLAYFRTGRWKRRRV
jgi:Na+-driven multidrug efflux pump